MARGKTAAKATPPKATKEEKLSIRFVVDDDDEVASIYVNFAEIAHSRHELTAFFAQLPGKLGPDTIATARETGELHVKPTVKLTLPPTLARGLIRALSSQIDAYEKQYGAIQGQNDKEEQQ